MSVFNEAKKSAGRPHTLSIVVENRPGVLTRVAGLFARRAYNIDSLSVAESSDPTISRMTVVVRTENELGLRQICQQVSKLIDVISVTDNTEDAIVARELALVKVQCDDTNRTEVLQLITIFRARTVDIGETELTIEVTGASAKINALLQLLEKYGILEMARTGETILARSVQP